MLDDSRAYNGPRETSAQMTDKYTGLERLAIIICCALAICGVFILIINI